MKVTPEDLERARPAITTVAGNFIADITIEESFAETMTKYIALDEVTIAGVVAAAVVILGKEEMNLVILGMWLQRKYGKNPS